jgi:ferredoxin
MSASQDGTDDRVGNKRHRLVVDVGACSRCGGCVELLPEVFRLRNDTGLIEIIDDAVLDEEAIAEAMKYCPEDCIYWEGE